MKFSLTSGFRAACVALLSFFSVTSASVRADVVAANWYPDYILHISFTSYNYRGANNWTYSNESVSLGFGDSIALYDNYHNYGEGPYDMWGTEFVFQYEWWEFIGSTSGGGGGSGGGSGNVAGLVIQFHNENPKNLPLQPDPDSTPVFYFFNKANSTLTVRGVTQSREPIEEDLQWRITDTVSGELFQDWVNSPAIYLFNTDERSYLVEYRNIGGGATYSSMFHFTQTNLAPNPATSFKIRSPDNSFPFHQERWGSCGIGAFRHLLHIHGKPVPTEDAIVQELINLGVPEWKWYSDMLTEGAGMNGAETNTYALAILTPRGVTLTHNQNMTPAQFEASLNNGAIHLVGITIPDYDYNEQNGMQPVKHVVVVRKAGNHYEVIDSGTGKVHKLPLAQIISQINFAGDPLMSGEIWTATSP